MPPHLTICHTLSVLTPLCYSLSFTKEPQNERSEDLLRYIKGGKNHILRHNWIFRQTCCLNNPHWQSSGIIIFLCKHYIVISDTVVGSFLDVLFFLLAVILSGLHDKPSKNQDWVTEKRA